MKAIRKKVKPPFRLEACGMGMRITYKGVRGLLCDVKFDAWISPDLSRVELTSGEIPFDKAVIFRNRLRRFRPALLQHVDLHGQGDTAKVVIEKNMKWKRSDRREFKKCVYEDRRDQARSVRDSKIMQMIRAIRKEHKVKAVFHEAVGNTRSYCAPMAVIAEQLRLTARYHQGGWKYIIQDHVSHEILKTTTEAAKVVAAVKAEMLKHFLNLNAA